MTEEEARRICREMDAVFCIRKRGKNNRLYFYISRWLPREVATALGYKISKSQGQQVDRYVCSMEKLHELEEERLRSLIASLPPNPNKQHPDAQHLDRSDPNIAKWHKQIGTPEQIPTRRRRTQG